MLTVEIKNNIHKNQENLLNIQEETLMKMKSCFQEMVCEIFVHIIKIIFLLSTVSFVWSIYSNTMV